MATKKPTYAEAWREQIKCYEALCQYNLDKGRKEDSCERCTIINDCPYK